MGDTSTCLLVCTAYWFFLFFVYIIVSSLGLLLTGVFPCSSVIGHGDKFTAPPVPQPPGTSTTVHSNYPHCFLYRYHALCQFSDFHQCICTCCSASFTWHDRTAFIVHASLTNDLQRTLPVEQIGWSFSCCQHIVLVPPIGPAGSSCSSSPHQSGFCIDRFYISPSLLPHIPSLALTPSISNHFSL